MALSNDAGIHNPRLRHREPGTRISRTVGPDTVEHDDNIGGCRGWMQHAVKPQRSRKRRIAQLPFDMIFKIGGKGGHIVARDGKPRRHGVTAAIDQKPRLMGCYDGRAQFNTPDRAARPLPDPAFHGNDTAGTVKPFAQPARYDPDNARMPAIACHDDRRAVRIGPIFRLIHCRFQDTLFDLLAFAVKLIELLR